MEAHVAVGGAEELTEDKPHKVFLRSLVFRRDYWLQTEEDRKLRRDLHAGVSYPHPNQANGVGCGVSPS